MYLGAIAGYLPSAMVRCISKFMNACYIARRNVISASALDRFEECVAQFHELRNIFLTTGVRTDFSLPRQHALAHYSMSIRLFGSPNGLCSSITESKHKEAVKNPWYRSNRHNALLQILQILLRWEKIQALRRRFASRGMLNGTTVSYMAGAPQDALEDSTPLTSEHATDEEGAPVEGVSEEALSVVVLSTRTGACTDFFILLTSQAQSAVLENAYPQTLPDLADFIQEPDLIPALQKFISTINNPTSVTSDSDSDLPEFHGRIRVHHSGLATYFAPSDLSGTEGMRQERIHSVPSWYKHPRRDTVFVVLDDNLPGMEGMVIARVLLFFSFHYKRVDYSCAYVNWFVRNDDEPDHDTGMWTVSLEKRHGKPVSQVINVKTIARAAHLIPIYGTAPVSSNLTFHNSLDSYQSFYINSFVDHHAYEFLTDS